MMLKVRKCLDKIAAVLLKPLCRLGRLCYEIAVEGTDDYWALEEEIGEEDAEDEDMV